MRALLMPCAAGLLGLAAVGGCVGDDPVPSETKSDDGGADANAPDTSTGDDAGSDARGAETRWSLSFGVPALGPPYVATSSDGSVAIASTYTGQPKIGTTMLPAATTTGTFVARLDPRGELVWAKGWDSGAAIKPTAVALGKDHRVYLAGDGAGFSFGAGGEVSGPPDDGTGSERHGFVARFAADDGAIDGITLIASRSGASAAHLKLALEGEEMIVAGSFAGTLDFDSGTTSVTATCPGAPCGLFAARYDGSTPAVAWAKSGTVSNASGDGANMHAVALDDDIVLACSFVGSSVSWSGSPAIDAVSADIAENALLVKLASNGGLFWARAFGDPSTSGSREAFPNSVAIARDKVKTVFFGGGFKNRLQLGSQTLRAAPPSSGSDTKQDGFFAALSPSTGEPLWARGVSGPEFDDVGSVMAFAGGDVLAAVRYQSGGIVVDGKGLENPATGGAGIALLRYATGGSLVSAASAKGIVVGLGPKVALLPNDGVAIAVAMRGTVTLGPLSVTSDANGTKPSMVYAGITP